MDNEQNPTISGLPNPQDLIADWLEDIDTLDLFATEVRPEWRQEVIEMKRTSAEQGASGEIASKPNLNVEILIGDADGLMLMFIPMDGSKPTASFRYRPLGLKYQYLHVDASVYASAMELMKRFPLKCFPVLELQKFDSRFCALTAFCLMAGETEKALTAYKIHTQLRECISTYTVSELLSLQ